MEEDRYKNKYRTTPFRKPNWDYGSHGLYFITICTHERIHYFGEVIETEEKETRNIVSLRKTPIAEIAYQNWLDIPKHFSFVELDELVIMPNHIHGILLINRPDKMDWDANKFGPQSQNLASVIRGYKVSVKKYATMNDIDFKWQSKYHDRVVRDEKEYQNIKHYIADNLNRWTSDPGNILLP
jgi:REP element-mobilizing transposase RayT